MTPVLLFFPLFRTFFVPFLFLFCTFFAPSFPSLLAFSDLPR